MTGRKEEGMENASCVSTYIIHTLSSQIALWTQIIVIPLLELPCPSVGQKRFLPLSNAYALSHTHLTCGCVRKLLTREGGVLDSLSAQGTKDEVKRPEGPPTKTFSISYSYLPIPALEFEGVLDCSSKGGEKGMPWLFALIWNYKSRWHLITLWIIYVNASLCSLWSRCMYQISCKISQQTMGRGKYLLQSIQGCITNHSVLHAENSTSFIIYFWDEGFVYSIFFIIYIVQISFIKGKPYLWLTGLSFQKTTNWIL